MKTEYTEHQNAVFSVSVLYNSDANSGCCTLQAVITMDDLKLIATGSYTCLSVCFPEVATHCGCIYHSPVAGFSLLVFEVS
jgi:hypothetical protein